jgi:hypothetical protein
MTELPSKLPREGQIAFFLSRCDEYATPVPGRFLLQVLTEQAGPSRFGSKLVTLAFLES